MENNLGLRIVKIYILQKEKNMLSKKSNIIAAAFATVAMVGGLLFFVTTQSQAATLEDTCKSSYDPKAIDLQKLRDCVKVYIDESVKKKGFMPTMDDLEASVKSMPIINQVCHPFSHFIGAGAIKELKGDVSIAIKHATDYCNWGYFHGMNVELANMYDGQELFDILLDGCNYVKKYNYNPYECAHGMGDAIDVDTNYNYNEALPYCESIEDEGMHENCAQGLFNHWADYHIVNIAKDTPELLTEEGKRIMNGSPYAPCETIKNAVSRRGCFDYMVRVNNAYKTGMAGWENYCLKYEDPDQMSCFQGVGREWAYNKNYTTEQVFTKCLVATTDLAEQICIIETINSRTQYMRDKKGSILKETCALFKDNPSVQTACRRAATNLKPYFDGDFFL